MNAKIAILVLGAIVATTPAQAFDYRSHGYRHWNHYGHHRHAVHRQTAHHRARIVYRPSKVIERTVIIVVPQSPSATMPSATIRASTPFGALR